MQEYLMSENHNTELYKLLFKARSKMLDIKLHKKWKYTDVTCVGCNQNEESESELMNCAGFSDSESGQNEPLSYDLFYSQTTNDIITVANYARKRLKIRARILERIT